MLVCLSFVFFFFKQTTAYERCISDWSSDVCSSDLLAGRAAPIRTTAPHIRIDMGSRHSIDMSYTMSADVYLGDVSSQVYEYLLHPRPCIFLNLDRRDWRGDEAFSHWRLGQVIEDMGTLPQALDCAADLQAGSSEEHTSELQSLMRISYAVFCL